MLSLQAIPFGHVRFERSSDWIPAMEVEFVIIFKLINIIKHNKITSNHLRRR
jgi:hypothetical protein